MLKLETATASGAYKSLLERRQKQDCCWSCAEVKILGVPLLDLQLGKDEGEIRVCGFCLIFSEHQRWLQGRRQVFEAGLWVISLSEM